MDCGYVRMVERSQELGFTLEACDPLWVTQHRLGKNLDSDFAIQLGIRRKVDFAHASRAEGREDFVRT